MQVKDLAAVSLNKPVRVFVNENTDVALGLRQEFIRIRANREGDREAIVAGIIHYICGLVWMKVIYICGLVWTKRMIFIWKL